MKTHPRGSSLLHASLLYFLCLVSGYGATIQLTTVSGLAGASASNGDTAIVAGYYAAGDGGGGTFTLDTASTATADDGLVFTSTASGRWLRQVAEGTLNVKMYGAKSGQSVTTAEAIENTERIQKALDGAANNGHEVIHFQGGYYKLGRPLVNIQESGVSKTAFGKASPYTLYAHVDGETAEGAFYYLRVGAHTNPSRPTLRLAGEGATLAGITESQVGNTLLVIRTKFTAVEVDGFTFRTAPMTSENSYGRYKGIIIVPMQPPPTHFYAETFTENLPAETQALRDAPTESITVKNSTFINCRTTISTPVIPRRDPITFAGGIQKVNIQNCDFLFPNGSNTEFTYVSDPWPSMALNFNTWVGTLNVSDCLFDGDTSGDATPGTNGNSRGPVDNFIQGGGLHNVIERNVVKHAGVEGISFARLDELQGLSRSANVTVAADKSMILRFARTDGVEAPLRFPQDLPPSLRNHLVGLRVRFTENHGDSAYSVDYGEYEIAEILEDEAPIAEGWNWTRIKLVSTGDPKNAAANSTINMNGTGLGLPRLYLAPSALQQHNMEMTLTVNGNYFGGDPVSNNTTGVWWYTSPAIRADDYRVTITENIFDRCHSGVLLIGHSYADETVVGSLIDRNLFEMVDYAGDSHLPQEALWFAGGVSVAAPVVRVTNNTFHSATNKRAWPIYASHNCGDLIVTGNSMTADRKLDLIEAERGYAVGLNNNTGALNADHPGLIANNSFRNFDGIQAITSPVYTQSGNSTGTAVPEFSISGNYTSVHSKNLSLAGGDALAPSLNFGVNGDANTGIFQPNVDSVGISLDGTLVAKFTQGTYTPSGGSPTEFNALQMTAGTDDRPGYGFLGDDDTGMFHKGEDSIGFATGGEERVGIQNTGLLIGAGTPLKMVKALSTNAQWTSSIAGASTGTTSNIAFTGAQLGDVVLIQWDPSNLPPSRLVMSAYVSSAGNIQIRAYNSGGTSVAAATYPVKIVVLQFGQ